MSWPKSKQTIAEAAINLQQANVLVLAEPTPLEKALPFVGQSQSMSHHFDSTSPCSGPNER